MAIPKKIAEQICVKAGDRMAILTDGRTIAAAKIELHEIVNRALMKEAVRVTAEDLHEDDTEPRTASGRAPTARAESEE